MGGAPIQPGQVIKAKYRIDRQLGAGGMGWVVSAEHVGLAQRVAIKFLHVALQQNPEVVARFAREARAASAIQSDHVARVLDVDTLDDGTPFMVMELLEGSDLASVRASGQPLAVHVAVGYVLEACEAIGEAHAMGIVHRDIKPANLFLARRPNGKTRVKVLDFGISKIAAGNDPGVTGTMAVMGSAHYMSPEQMISARDVDARTDIWALGATLYEITTATLPFPGETVTQVCAQVMTKSPPPPSRWRAHLPEGFDEVILRCLMRERDERYGSVAELVAALTPFAVERGAGIAFDSTRAVDLPLPTGVATRPGGHGAPSSPALPPGSSPTVAALPSSHPAAPSAPSASSPASAPHASSGLSQMQVLPPHGAWTGSPASQPQAPPDVVFAMPRPFAALPIEATAGPVSNTLIAPQHRKRRVLPAMLGCAGVVATILMFTMFVGFWKRGDRRARAAASAAAAQSDGAPSASAESVAGPPPVPAIPAAADSTGGAASAEARKSPAAADSTKRKEAPKQGEARPTTAPEPPKPAANCNPPFILNPNGSKRAKPECL